MRDYTLTYRGEGAFNILLLRKHLVEQMEHISLCRHDETHAVIVELIDHLHKTVQNVRLRHIQHRNLYDTSNITTTSVIITVWNAFAMFS